jgi:hypothetical protein
VVVSGHDFFAAEITRNVQHFGVNLPLAPRLRPGGRYRPAPETISGIGDGVSNLQAVSIHPSQVCLVVSS